jgi:peptidoglycan biosynthesis protein MviN/MurJ (putative lipid II flippase)
VILTAVLNLMLNIVLIRWFGNQGAALSKLLSMMVFFVLTFYFAQKAYPIPYELKRVFLMLLVAAGIYSISLLFNTLEVVPRIAVKTSLVILYPFVLFLLGFYHDTELDSIRSGWRKWSNPSAFAENVRRLTHM